jgi:hypothetical protein
MLGSTTSVAGLEADPPFNSRALDSEDRSTHLGDELCVVVVLSLAGGLTEATLVGVDAALAVLIREHGCHDIKDRGRWKSLGKGAESKQTGVVDK